MPGVTAGWKDRPAAGRRCRVDVQAVREKVRRIMTERFGAVTMGPDGTILFNYQQAFGYLVAEQWADGHVLVHVRCTVADEVPVTPALHEWASTDGQAYHFGHVFLLPDDPPATTASVLVVHSLLGDTVDPDELLYAVFGVFGAANDLSSIVPARFGGKAFNVS